MENITFEINGYTTVFKPSLNFGQKRQIQKLMAGAMSLNAETNTANTNIAGSIVFEAQDLTLKMLLISFKTPSGQVYEGSAAYDAVQNLEDDEVGKAIYAKIKEVTDNAALTEENKKK